MTIENIVGTSYVFENLDDTYYKYRVKAIRGDDVSQWSEFQYVLLSTNSGISTIEIKDRDELDVLYSIDGKRILTPSHHGIYIRKRGGILKKIYSR